MFTSQSRYYKAEELFKRAITILEKARGPESFDLIVPLRTYEDLLRKICRAADAEKIGDRAQAPKDKHFESPLHH